MIPFVATFERLPEKETPGCHRYGLKAGQVPAIETIYIRKKALGTQPPPDHLKVTIEADKERG